MDDTGVPDVMEGVCSVGCGLWWLVACGSGVVVAWAGE